MTLSQTCDRCGKGLGSGIGADGPVGIEMTGESICGDCMMKMMESVAPSLVDDIDAQAFAASVVDFLAQKTGLPPSRFSVALKTFLSHDVEIKAAENCYQIVVLIDLAHDPSRYTPAREYLVSWIKEHPMSAGNWVVQKSTNQELSPSGRFVFLFLPETYPPPPTEFGAKVTLTNLLFMSREILILQSDLGKERCLKPYLIASSRTLRSTSNWLSNSVRNGGDIRHKFGHDKMHLPSRVGKCHLRIRSVIG